MKQPKQLPVTSCPPARGSCPRGRSTYRLLGLESRLVRLSRDGAQVSFLNDRQNISSSHGCYLLFSYRDVYVAANLRNHVAQGGHIGPSIQSLTQSAAPTIADVYTALQS